MEHDDLLDPTVNQGTGGGNQQLPNATAVLVLGIVSIVGCIFYAIPGIVCGIIAIVLHNKDKQIYASNPTAFETSFKNSKAGNICAIIGLSLSLLYLLIILYLVIFVTTFAPFRFR